MGKRIWSLTVGLYFGLGMAALYFQEQPVVQAEELSAGRTGVGEIVSRGNIFYQDDAKRAKIYGADFSLLWDNLSTISGEVFDPASYAHIHAAQIGDNAEEDWNFAYVEEKAMPVKLPEIIDEAAEVWETEELPAFLEEETELQETETQEMEKLPELTEEEMEEADSDESSEEAGKDTEEDDPEELPEISVSGNDCPIEEAQSRREEITEISTDEGGEKE